MKINRRRFTQGVTAAALLAGVPCAGYLVFGRAHEIEYLRPPGAVDEKEFHSLCIKCGQCVQVCPYHAVSLLDINESAASGTPIIQAEKRGCYLCDLLPCVLACPTEALNHDVSAAEQVRMGFAVLTDKTRCLAYRKELVSAEMIEALTAHGTHSAREKELAGKLRNHVGQDCTLCRDFCPYPDRDSAITLAAGAVPEFHEHCVGCAVCQELCPVKIIEIIPRKTFQDFHRKDADS